MTQPAFHLRHATAADNVLLSEIGAETFIDSFAADNTPEDMAVYLAGAFSPEIQARELANPASRFLIVEVGGAPAGYAHLRFGPPPPMVVARQPMEIGRFYARRPWIGKGLGAFLMRACLSHAQQAGCDVVWLDVWERNPRAIAFYRKWGFELAGTQPFTLGHDLQNDWIMARPAHLPDAP